MGQYLLPNNRVSDRIRARPASTVVAMAEGGALMPDDGGLEETTVALTSSMVLQGTCRWMALFGANPYWPCGRTKLHPADMLTPHSEEKEEEEEKQIDDGGFRCYEGNPHGYGRPIMITRTMNKEDEAILAHTNRSHLHHELGNASLGGMVKGNYVARVETMVQCLELTRTSILLRQVNKRRYSVSGIRKLDAW